MNEFELRAVDQLLELDDSLITDPFIIKVAAELIKNGDDLMDVIDIGSDLTTDSGDSVELSTRGAVTGVEIERGINPDGVLQAIPTAIKVVEKYGSGCFEITNSRFSVSVTFFKKVQFSKDDTTKLENLGFKRLTHVSSTSSAFFRKNL